MNKPKIEDFDSENEYYQAYAEWVELNDKEG